MATGTHLKIMLSGNGNDTKTRFYNISNVKHFCSKYIKRYSMYAHTQRDTPTLTYTYTHALTTMGYSRQEELGGG